MNSVDSWMVQQQEWLDLIDAAESRLLHCLAQLSDAQLRWRPFDGSNAIANQLLHICGNLQQWCVDGILQLPSHRDRDREFSATDVPRAELLQKVSTTLSSVRSVLREIRSDELGQARTIQGFTVTVAGALTHTIPHLVGHTHQIMLLTRMQLGAAYQFHWAPDAVRGKVPI